jgi:uncharacterized protein (DUF3820 family)
MSKYFISCVSGEFGGYRSRLEADLGSTDVHWITQEGFPQSRFDTVVKLDTEIRQCDAVIHLVGRGSGATANDLAVADFLNNEATAEFARILISAMRPFCDITALRLTYTHWEVLLAKARGIPVFVFRASGEITDGHAHDKPPFVPHADDTAIMEQHDQRLKEIRRHEDPFDGYDSLKNVIFRTLMADKEQLCYRQKEDLKTLQNAQDKEAELQRRRTSRFGLNTVNEVKYVLINNPELGDPRFLTTVCARLNKGIVSWNFPEAWRFPEDTFNIIDFLIDWAVDRPDRGEFLSALVLLLRKRAAVFGLDDAGVRLDQLLNAACKECNLSKDAIEGACLRAEGMDFATDAQGVLLTNVEQLPTHTIGRGAFRWAGICQYLGVLGEKLEDLVENARNLLNDRPELAVITPCRVEVFSDFETLDFPWERRKADKFHLLPIVLRLNRQATDWEDVAKPPQKINKKAIPSWIGTCHPSPLPFERQVEQTGFFFAAWTAPEERDQVLFCNTVRCASVGVWLRHPVTKDDAESVLDQMDDINLEDLPSHVYQRRQKDQLSAWQHAVILFDREADGFPRRSANAERQRNTSFQMT